MSNYWSCELVICPNCKGTGTKSKQIWGSDYEQATCEECDGFGRMFQTTTLEKLNKNFNQEIK